MSEIKPSDAPVGSSLEAAEKTSKRATKLLKKNRDTATALLAKPNLSGQELAWITPHYAGLSLEQQKVFISYLLLNYNTACQDGQRLAQMLSKLKTENAQLALDCAKVSGERDNLRGLNTVFVGKLKQAHESLATLKADCESASHNQIKLLVADTAKQMSKLNTEINALRIQLALQQHSLKKFQNESATRQTVSDTALALAEARAASAEGEVERLTETRTIDGLVRTELGTHLACVQNIFLKAQDDRNTAGEVFKTRSIAFEADPNNESKEKQLEEAIETMRLANKKFKEAEAVWNQVKNITITQVDDICQNARATLQKDLAKFLQSEESPVSPTVNQPLASKKTFADCARK